MIGQLKNDEASYNVSLVGSIFRQLRTDEYMITAR